MVYLSVMSSNPYEPPSSTELAVLPADELRPVAALRFQQSCLILLAPALLNFICFHLTLRFEIVLLDLLGFIALALLVWFRGFAIIEGVSSMLHTIVCGHRARQEWTQLLHKRLESLPGFIAVGSVLWLLWLIGFYAMQINFYLISYAIGIPAHILGACFYVPLITGWFRIVRAGQAG